MLNKDYKEMLQFLSVHDVKFLVIGAYALGAYGYPRATGDLDIWVLARDDNSNRVYEALKEFGAPLIQLDKSTFSRMGVIFQIGIAPRRIDIITQIDGVNFDSAWENRQIIEIDEMQVPFISKQDLITNKLSTGREKDRLDAQQLQSND
jgi:hypothetical protein